MQQSVLLQNLTVADAGAVYRCDLLVEHGTITSLHGQHADVVYDCSKLTAFPGLFDMHVHLRDPGFTAKEDILTGCAAALAGGVTGLACMPNTNPTIDTPETVQYILHKAAETGVQVCPVGCITREMQGESLSDFKALQSAGICAVSDDGRPVENAETMRQALVEADRLHLPVISHCEDLSIIHGGKVHRGRVAEELHLPGMDRASEDSVTAREMILAASTGTPIHIAHVSTKGSVAMIRFAKQQGVKVTCETCPHYFLLTEEAVRSMDADYRMNPPLREESDRLAVLEGVLDGTIDCIVTDHAPHTPEEKQDFYTAPNGVIGMETSLAATLTLYHEGKLTMPQIVRLMSSRPRQILGLPEVTIASGAAANFCLVDLDYEWEVDPEKLHSKARNAVFKGMRFSGKPVMTVSDGEIRYQDADYPFVMLQK
jgi:dihydroorotase